MSHPYRTHAVFFGTSGDLDYLQRLTAQQGFHPEVLAEQGLEKDAWRVDYFTFRLTQQ